MFRVSELLILATPVCHSFLKPIPLMEIPKVAFKELNVKLSIYSTGQNEVAIPWQNKQFSYTSTPALKNVSN